jgi:hypothetical protein
MQRKDAPTTRRAYVDHLRAGVASWPLFLVLVRSGRAPVTGDLPGGKGCYMDAVVMSLELKVV